MLASGHGMSKRRVMAKAKVYGFSPWVDQVDAINQMMKDTGERNESALLRKLVDEALSARRRKSQSTQFTEEPNHAGVRLKTIERAQASIGADRSAWTLVAARGHGDRHRHETRRFVQADVGKDRFPTRIDLRPELKEGKRLFGAYEDKKNHSRRRTRLHQSRHGQALH